MAIVVHRYKLHYKNTMKCIGCRILMKFNVIVFISNQLPESIHYESLQNIK